MLIERQPPFKVGCCGASGSEDYIAAHKPVPVECRDMATGNEYRYGCAQQGWWSIQTTILIPVLITNILMIFSALI